MTCPHCDRLRAEIRELKEELREWERGDPDSIDGNTALIARVLRTNPQPARIIHRLMTEASRVVSKESLIETMRYGGEGRDAGNTTDEINALKVVLSKSRRALESVGLFDAIGCVWGGGYIMSKSKANELARIISQC